jgi:hypothetical protein
MMFVNSGGASPKPASKDTRRGRVLDMGKHDPPEPPVDPNTDGKADGIPKEPDPGKHEQ